MKHAFLITAYKNPAQLGKVINHLESPDSYFYIHVDKKSGLSATTILSHVRKKENIFFIKNPVKVFWGGFSHLRAFGLLMEEAAKNREIDYFHSISGQCFPAMSVNEFSAFFAENKGKEFITWFPLEKMNWSGGSFNRIQLYHLNDIFDIRKKFWKRINSRFLQLQLILGVRRKLPPEIEKFYAGGTWWSLSRKAIGYILVFLNAHPEFLRRFKFTHCSEEIIFQSILLNSDLKENIVSDDLRYIDWETRNGNCPANLDESDYRKIAMSGKLFARKIEDGVSDRLVEMLAEKIASPAEAIRVG